MASFKGNFETYEVNNHSFQLHIKSIFDFILYFFVQISSQCSKPTVSVGWDGGGRFFILESSLLRQLLTAKPWLFIRRHSHIKNSRKEPLTGICCWSWEMIDMPSSGMRFIIVLVIPTIKNIKLSGQKWQKWNKYYWWLRYPPSCSWIREWRVD